MNFTGFVLTLFVCSWTAAAQAPAEGSTAERIIGEVTAVNAGTKQIELKSDKGDTVAVSLGEKTLFLRVPPGEKDLKKASRIALADVSVGDRVLARGAVSADQKSIAAAAVIVMTRSDLAQMRQRKAEEWQKRGVSGAVDEVDAANRRFTIKIRTREGAQPLTVETTEKTELFRYAPDSVRFSDAKPGTFADIKTGDQVRVLGDKDAAGAVLKAEQIVSGSFKQVAGQVVSINAQAGEIRITDLNTKKPLVVTVNQDSSLKRLPPFVAAMLARRLNPAPAGAGGTPVRPASSGAPGGERPGGSPGAGPRAGGGDVQQMMERIPAMTLAELKAGDDIIVSSTTGADPSRLTAIAVIAGVEPLLRAAPERATSFGGWNFGEIGMPQ